MRRSSTGARAPSHDPPAPPSSLTEAEELPTHDPRSDIGKKVAARARLAENAVHVIPAVVVICAAILWFLSSPEWRK